MSGAVFAYQWIRRDLATVTDTDIAGATGSTYTVTTEDEGKGLMVRVTFTDDAGNEESLTSFAVIVSPPLVIPDDEPANTPATGAPGIDGSPVVGQTLTATTSDIGDDDGIVDAAFSLPVAGRRCSYRGRVGVDIHRGRRGRGQDHQGEGDLHRRRGQRGVADQRANGGGDAAAADGQPSTTRLSLTTGGESSPSSCGSARNPRRASATRPSGTVRSR